jgi:uncharacterized protein
MVSTRSEVVQSLNRFQKSEGAKLGLLRVGIFGSAARDRLTDSSDIDVVVELADPNLLTLVRIKRELEAILGREVDIIHYRPTMNAFLKRRIDQEAVYVGR